MASNRTRQITLHAAGIRTALSPSLLTFQSARPAGSHSRAVRFETRTRHQNFIFTACAAALATNFGWPIRSFLVRLNSLQKHHEASHVQLNLLVCLSGSSLVKVMQRLRFSHQPDSFYIRVFPPCLVRTTIPTGIYGIPSALP